MAKTNRILLLLLLILSFLLCCAYLERLSQKNDVSSDDRVFAEQIEKNILINKNSNVNVSEVEGKVSMTVSTDSIGNLDITIINNSDVDIDVGRDFSLEKMVGETWEDVPLSLFHRDDLIVISPGGCYNFRYNIGNTVFLERNTTYQVVKVISAGQTDYSVLASFEIQ